jgi:NTE family protein
MTRNALVLGGGGILGISWEVGLLAGLAEEGVDVTAADLLVGTSAGAVVSTQLAQGRKIGELVEEHLAQKEAAIFVAEPVLDLQYLMQVLAKWSSFPEMTPAACAEVGAMALAVKVAISEERFLSYFDDLVGPEWPEREIRLTAVDAESGAFRVWTRDEGVPLRKALASSCAVPGLFPCVSIDGRRYQDGGVRSGTNADLAAGYDTVLIVAPLGDGAAGIGPALGTMARREAEALMNAGANVELVFPDAKCVEATGVNRMDPTRRPLVAEAAMRQGRDVAALVRDAWSMVAAWEQVST